MCVEQASVGKPVTDQKNRFLNGFRSLAKRWENRLIFDELFFCEGYIKRRFGIAVEFRIPLKTRHAQTTAMATYLHPPAEHPRPGVAYDHEVPRLGNLNSGNDDIVFVEIIELANGPEVVTLPAFRRCYVIKNNTLDFWEVGLYWSAFDGIHKVIPNFICREREFGLGFSTGACKHVPGVVKGAAKIVDGITQQEKYSGRQRIHMQDQISLPRLFIRLEEQEVIALPLEALEGGVQIIDVLLGPFDL